MLSSKEAQVCKFVALWHRLFADHFIEEGPPHLATLSPDPASTDQPHPISLSGPFLTKLQ